MVTPFRGRSVGYETLERLVGRAADARLSGVVALGTTGESPTVTEEERERVIACAVNAAQGRMRVLVGAGSHNLRHALDNVAQAARLGADGLLVVTPYYSKPTQPGLRRYFVTLADASPLPIVLYHIPARCGVGISLPLVLELARHSHIIGIKDAGGDVQRVSDIARQAPDDFAVLSGDDPLTLPMISVGAVGVVSVLSNIAPGMTRELVEAALSGDFGTALALHRRLSPLCAALFLETSPAPIKAAMNIAGMRVGSVRPPLAPVTFNTRRALKRALAEVGELR